MNDQLCTASLDLPRVAFRTPSYFRDLDPPTELLLVGDSHIVRGSTTVIGGAPGIGKSRAALYLAIAGATDKRWFDRQVHRRFKTAILQSENGICRLSRDLKNLDYPNLDDFIRISEPPPFGINLQDKSFRDALVAELKDFNPDVVVVDPWNAVARDDKQQDYLNAFRWLRESLPTGENEPAVVIVAHTRKPKADERQSGRGLLHLLSGSYVLGSVPRSVFVLQAASDDTQDERIVVTCCKNNDGEMGETSAWRHSDGIFVRDEGFDLDAFTRGLEPRATISHDHIRKVFESGKVKLTRQDAIEKLMRITGFQKSACYAALKIDGKFGTSLKHENDVISWIDSLNQPLDSVPVDSSP